MIEKFLIKQYFEYMLPKGGKQAVEVWLPVAPVSVTTFVVGNSLLPASCYPGGVQGLLGAPDLRRGMPRR
ncbi:hypothetical protein GCM10027514_04110 [Azotobacter armeniacus]